MISKLSISWTFVESDLYNLFLNIWIKSSTNLQFKLKYQFLIQTQTIN